MLLDVVIIPPAKLRNKIGEMIQKAAKGYPFLLLFPNEAEYEIINSES